MQFVGTPPVAESVWEYEERESSMLPTSMLLVRVIIGKVKDRNRLESLLRTIPVLPGGGVELCLMGEGSYRDSYAG